MPILGDQKLGEERLETRIWFARTLGTRCGRSMVLLEKVSWNPL